MFRYFYLVEDFYLNEGILLRGRLCLELEGIGSLRGWILRGVDDVEVGLGVFIREFMWVFEGL